MTFMQHFWGKIEKNAIKGKLTIDNRGKVRYNPYMIKKGNSMIIQTKTVNGKTFNLSKYGTHMSIWEPAEKLTTRWCRVLHVGKPAYIKRLWREL